MNYLVSGTFKRGLATNVDQNVTVDIAGLRGSTAIYTATPTDAALNGTANGEVIAYFLKLGGVAAYRLIDITQINAGGGNDLVDLTNSANPYLHAVTIDGGTGNDTIWAGPGDDDLVGGNDNDSIWGGDGDDVLGLSAGGENGNDTQYGGPGNDTVWTSSGFDYIDAGPGDDWIRNNVNGDDIAPGETLDGGAGYDILYHSSGGQRLVLPGWNGTDHIGIEEIRGPGSGGIEASSLPAGTPVFYDFSGVVMTGIDGIYGTQGNDTIIAANGYDGFIGGEAGPGGATFGNDSLVGGTGNERLSGYEGNDSLYGNDGNDNLVGYAGNDLLNGGAGTDTLTSSGGSDTFIGGAGADSIFGTGGANHRVVYESVADSTPTARDRISTINAGRIIDLSAIDAISGTPDDNAFTFIGTAAFTNGVAGQLRAQLYQTTSIIGLQSNTYLRGDVNGDTVTDFEVDLWNVAPTTITADWFVL